MTYNRREGVTGLDDWVFGTVLRHAQLGAVATVMFVCGGAAPDWWWGMWLDTGTVVRFSGRTTGRMWLVVG